MSLTLASHEMTPCNAIVGCEFRHQCFCHKTEQITCNSWNNYLWLRVEFLDDKNVWSKYSWECSFSSTWFLILPLCSSKGTLLLIFFCFEAWNFCPTVLLTPVALLWRGTASTLGAKTPRYEHRTKILEHQQQLLPEFGNFCLKK